MRWLALQGSCVCRRCRRLPGTSLTLSPSLRVAPGPQEIAPFEEPKIELEQYPTGPHLASRLLYTVGSGLPPILPWLRADACAGACGKLRPMQLVHPALS